MADYLPLVTAAVSVALTGLLARQFLERRKRHQLVWTVSLALLGLAAVLAFLGNADVVGWNAALYRLYLPLTALPVGLIGFGVLLLFRNYPKVARAYGYYWLATALLISGIAAAAPIVDPAGLALEGPNVGGRFLPLFFAFSWLQTVPGAAVFVGGGLYTWYRERSRGYGLVLALGGILFTIAGLSSRLGLRDYFFVITMIASIVTFIGFILSTEISPATVGQPAKA